MFIIDTKEYQKTRHNNNQVLLSDQYNTEYPGLLRNFVNDYYFDEIVNWSLAEQKSYNELSKVITEFNSNNCIGQDIFQYITPGVDYIWVVKDGITTVILEIGKRKVCYLKNIVKIHNDIDYSNLWITIANIYGKILIPFNICESELLNFEPLNICGLGYYVHELTKVGLYIFRSKNGKWEQLLSNPNKCDIAVVCKNEFEWRKIISKFKLLYNLLSYNNLSLEINRKNRK
jgi:hypothetical protein